MVHEAHSHVVAAGNKRLLSAASAFDQIFYCNTCSLTRRIHTYLLQAAGRMAKALGEAHIVGLDG
jgi:hypothetical protein